jgi:hypothetical protein
MASITHPAPGFKAGSSGRFAGERTGPAGSEQAWTSEAATEEKSGSKPRFRLFLKVCPEKSGTRRVGLNAVERKRPQALATALFAAATMLSASAYADCGADMQKLAQDRNVQLQAVNDFAKAAHGKPMDAAAFCAKSAGLIRAETALIAYMEKNKDWCSFPDEAISQLKEHHIKNAGFNAKACAVAAQIKKMKEQQEAGGGPQVQPLPTGPL